MEGMDDATRDKMLDESFAHMALQLDIAKEAIRTKDYAEAAVRFALVTNITESVGIYLSQCAMLVQGPEIMEARLTAIEAETYANLNGRKG